MKHTYLFEEGKWIARGTYFDEKGRTFQLEGQTIITHSSKAWINDGSMKILTDEPIELFNRYEVTPFDHREITSWKSINPALGELRGKFMVVHDSIMSKYVSGDGKYSGYEYLKIIDCLTYENRGFSFIKDEKLSSWAVELTKVE